MHEKMTQDAGAHSNSIRFGKRAVGELHSRRRPHGYDVTLRTGRVEGGAKLTDNFDTAMTDLIEVIDRSDYRGGARFGGENCLRGVEDEQTGHTHAIIGKPPDGTQRILDEWNLNDDLVRDPRELLAVSVCIVTVHGVDSDEYRHVDQSTDLHELLALLLLLLTENGGR